MKNHLEISIYENNSFYHLYSEGNHTWKTFDKKRQTTLLYYPPGAVVVLYYTYKAFREAIVIRFTPNKPGLMLPGLSHSVSILFRVSASKVDKTRRTFGWLKTHTKNAFIHPDNLYYRLYFIIEQRGKISYFSIKKLVENYSIILK